MSAIICNYYVGANSARGYVSYFEDNIMGIDKIFLLEGGSDQEKSTLIKNIGINWYIKGYDIEFIHSASDENEIEAVIISALSTAVINSSLQYVERARFSTTNVEPINMEIDEPCRTALLDEYLISGMKSKVKEYYDLAYDQFKKALSIHDEWEKIYLNNIDFKKLDEIAENSIKKLLGDRSLSKEGISKNRFFGSATGKGTVNFVMDLTSCLGKRYFIKGRPGSGKSTLLKKIADAAQNRGFDTEVYHCGFDPRSLDMVIVRELDVAIFDSTAPHEFYPSRESDEVIDIYNTAITAGTDEKYRSELALIISKYKEAASSGAIFLAKAKELEDQIGSIIKEKINTKTIDKVYDELNSKLNSVFDSLSETAFNALSKTKSDADTNTDADTNADVNADASQIESDK